MRSLFLLGFLCIIAALVCADRPLEPAAVEAELPHDSDDYMPSRGHAWRQLGLQSRHQSRWRPGLVGFTRKKRARWKRQLPISGPSVEVSSPFDASLMQLESATRALQDLHAGGRLEGNGVSTADDEMQLEDASRTLQELRAGDRRQLLGVEALSGLEGNGVSAADDEMQLEDASRLLQRMPAAGRRQVMGVAALNGLDGSGVSTADDEYAYSDPHLDGAAEAPPMVPQPLGADGFHSLWARPGESEIRSTALAVPGSASTPSSLFQADAGEGNIDNRLGWPILTQAGEKDASEERLSYLIAALQLSAKQKNVSASSKEGDQNTSALFQADADEAIGASPATAGNIDDRPGDPKNASIVKFGVTLRAFFGFLPAQGTFKADLVLAFEWEDARAAALITTGDNLTLPQDSAEKKMWMPAMGVVSQNNDGVQVLSTSITIDRTGKVQKIQRILLLCMHNFNAGYFPMEAQKLTVVLSSTKYMSEDLLLTVIPDGQNGASKVSESVFDGTGFVLNNFNTRAFVEKSGSLHKSRGVLEVEIHRLSGKFVKGVLSPLLIIATLSYAVFWLPLLAPFVMPRVAMSMFAFLSLVTLKAGYAAQLVGVNGVSWGDVYIDGFMLLVLFSVVCNIGMEYISHGLKLADAATLLNSEMKMIFPALVCSTLLQCTLLMVSGYVTFSVVTIGYAVRSMRKCEECLNPTSPCEVPAAAAPLVEGKPQEGESPRPPSDRDAAAGPRCSCG